MIYRGYHCPRCTCVEMEAQKNHHDLLRDTDTAQNSHPVLTLEPTVALPHHASCLALVNQIGCLVGSEFPMSAEADWHSRVPSNPVLQVSDLAVSLPAPLILDRAHEASCLNRTPWVALASI